MNTRSKKRTLCVLSSTHDAYTTQRLKRRNIIDANTKMLEVKYNGQEDVLYETEPLEWTLDSLFQLSKDVKQENNRILQENNRILQENIDIKKQLNIQKYEHAVLFYLASCVQNLKIDKFANPILKNLCHQRNQQGHQIDKRKIRETLNYLDDMDDYSIEERAEMRKVFERYLAKEQY